tara:strand:- start:206 stop:718 length:513 start_codon:yes stop_codon:yes gene_type:complete
MEQTLSMEPKLIDQLPSKRIHESAISAWRVSALVFGLLYFTIFVVGLLLYIFEDVSIYLPVGTGLLSLLLYYLTAFVFPKIRWQRWRYDVTEQGVDMHRGIIILKRTMVPINRIQHVDTKQGPIYRRYGLSSISLSTAATTHDIPALDDATALELRNLISEMVRKVKEDV